MEDAGRSFEAQSFFSGNLGNSALGCEVAVQNDEVPFRFDRVVEIAHDFLTVRIVRNVSQIFCDRLTRDSHAITVQQTMIEQAKQEIEQREEQLKQIVEIFNRLKNDPPKNRIQIVTVADESGVNSESDSIFKSLIIGGGAQSDFVVGA